MCEQLLVGLARVPTHVEIEYGMTQREMRDLDEPILKRIDVDVDVGCARGREVRGRREVMTVSVVAAAVLGLIAPLAPRFGIVLCGSTRICAAVAAAPHSR